MLFFVLHPDPKDLRGAPGWRWTSCAMAARPGTLRSTTSRGRERYPSWPCFAPRHFRRGFTNIHRAHDAGKEEGGEHDLIQRSGQPAGGHGAGGRGCGAAAGTATAQERQLVFYGSRDAAAPPSWQEFDSILADAGQHALAYRESLPDFSA